MKAEGVASVPAKARSAVASTITLSRREKAAERARQRYAKTHSNKALVAMVNATTKALAAYARLRAPGGPANRPSDVGRRA